MAIKALAWMVRTFDAPVYCYHEIVHNKIVVDRFKKLGVIFVDDLGEIPPGRPIMLSAHGSAPQVVQQAIAKGSYVVDSVCPLVTKVHIEVTRHCRAGRDVVLIGHEGHPEVEGTMGQWFSEGASGNIYLVEDIEEVMNLEVSQPEHFAFTTQTTLSVDETREVIAALRSRFPKIEGPRHDDICYATQNRQDAVRELASQCDLIFVVGSVNSSNSNRLRELAEKNGARAYLVDGADDIRPEWLDGAVRIGVTAGASAPEVLVQGVISYLQQLGGSEVSELDGEPENMVFALPKELRITLLD